MHSPQDRCAVGAHNNPVTRRRLALETRKALDCVSPIRSRCHMNCDVRVSSTRRLPDFDASSRHVQLSISPWLALKTIVACAFHPRVEDQHEIRSNTDAVDELGRYPARPVIAQATAAAAVYPESASRRGGPPWHDFPAPHSRLIVPRSSKTTIAGPLAQTLCFRSRRNCANCFPRICANRSAS